jgi:hypothetical protein
VSNLILLILLKFSWSPSAGAESYRLYAISNGQTTLLAETIDTSVIVSLPVFESAAVSAVKGDFESALSAPVSLPSITCLAKIAELRKVCGKKCRRVK